MSEFYLYSLETTKPYNILVLKSGERTGSWLLSARENLDFRNQNRIAFETDLTIPDDPDTPDIEITLNGKKVKMSLIEKGELSLKSDSNNKLEFGLTSDEDSTIRGDFVFMVPSWGRNTFRKIWVLIPV